MVTSFTRFALDYGTNYMYTPSNGSGASAGIAAFLLVVWLAWAAAIIVAIVALWKMYSKAGKPGWAAIVPFYNTWVLAEIGGKPGWWMFLMFIPFVNIVVAILIALGIARNFGKSEAFGIFGLWLFSIIGYLILGFGSATYEGSNASSHAQPAAPVAPTSV